MKDLRQNKIKVGILTRHAVPNYGSFLQALATEYMIIQLDGIPTIMDYRREDESPKALSKSYAARSKTLGGKIYYNTLWRFSHIVIEKKLRLARKKYLHVSEYVDCYNIKKCIRNFDVLMTGSDQVWNVVGSGETECIDGRYFWCDADINDYIISYAASFGDSVLTDAAKAQCAQWLSKFNNISVREDTGVALVKGMGLRAVQVLDPTFLVDKEKWERLATRGKRKINYPYALVYNLHSDSNMNEFILGDVSGSGLKLLSITTTFRHSPGENIFCPSIEEFLWLFKNAECIYADSFHAIAFAVIFKVPFVVVLPKQYSTRLESVLTVLGLENRVSNQFKGNAWDKALIDWDKVYERLDSEKMKSLQWLKKVLSEKERRESAYE